MVCGGSHGQNGHQVWNVRSADGQIVRGQCREKPGAGPVPLGRIRVQVLNGDTAAQSLCRQDEGSVAPVALYGQLSRAVEAAAGNGEALGRFAE